MAEEILGTFPNDSVALYLRGRALLAMDEVGDAAVDLMMSLESAQKHRRRRKLENEITAHLHEAEKRLRHSPAGSKAARPDCWGNS